MMTPMPMCEVHVDRLSGAVSALKHALDPDLNLSIPSGEFVRMSWDAFMRAGADVVAEALRYYLTNTPEAQSAFECMTEAERVVFFKASTSFLVCERQHHIWQVDLMKPENDGKTVLPLPVPKRGVFRHCNDPAAFAALLRSLADPELLFGGQ